MTLFGINNTKNTFEIHVLGLRIGWTIICKQNAADYAIMFHIGFFNPGVTLMLSCKR